MADKNYDVIIIGAGYLVANAVAEDLGIDKWWTEP